MIQGEATITLEDVEVLTGLPTDDVPVTVAVDRRPPGAICEELLGVQPPASSCTRQSVKISWVKGMFDRLPAGALVDALERFPHIAHRYVAGGAPPDADIVPRGVRWMSVIQRHHHRVAMRLEDIRYALDRSTEFLVRNLSLL
ncbi:Protein MAIN-LIKE 2 [Linum perenne]